MNELLDMIGLLDAKHVATPMSYRKLLSKVDGHDLYDFSEYQWLVKSLQYLTLTRLDIAFVVNKLCQSVALPTDLHMLSIKRLLKYVIGSLQFSLALHKMWDTGLDRVMWC